MNRLYASVVIAIVLCAVAAWQCWFHFVRPNYSYVARYREMRANFAGAYDGGTLWYSTVQCAEDFQPLTEACQAVLLVDGHDIAVYTMSATTMRDMGAESKVYGDEEVFDVRSRNDGRALSATFRNGQIVQMTYTTHRCGSGGETDAVFSLKLRSGDRTTTVVKLPISEADVRKLFGKPTQVDKYLNFP